MNTTRDVVAPAMRAAAEDFCGPDAEKLYSSDTRDLLAFFVTLRRLLREVSSDLEVEQRFMANCWNSAVFTTLHSQISTSRHTNAS